MKTLNYIVTLLEPVLDIVVFITVRALIFYFLWNWISIVPTINMLDAVLFVMALRLIQPAPQNKYVITWTNKNSSNE